MVICEALYTKFLYGFFVGPFTETGGTFKFLALCQFNSYRQYQILTLGDQVCSVVFLFLGLGF